MTIRNCLLAAALAATAVGGAACQSKKAKQARAPEQLIVRDVPAPLRGTIGSRVTFERTDTILVSGFGLVVGLNGTGGGPYQERVAGHMEQELARRGVSQSAQVFAGTPFEGLSPREVLESKDVAIVLVQAAIPPGAPAGSKFDVLVRSLPQSSTTSLEGGTLYTTDLRPGPATVQGAAQARIIGEAGGPIFINPFAEPGRETNGVTRTAGRVLAGGKITNPLKIGMILDNPSAAVAREMVSTINTRFPQGDEPDKTARGRDHHYIELRVPSEYQERPADFLRVVQGLQVNSMFPDELARRYAEDLKNEPALADQLSYCLEAVGEPAKKFLRPLYDYPEFRPRRAALRAGAALGDIQAVPALTEMALRGNSASRVWAIRHLAEIDAGPRIDESLVQLLGDRGLDVRVAAMEGLTRRAERVEALRFVRANAGRAPTWELERLARERVKGRLTGDTIQGIRRLDVKDTDGVTTKFVIDLVPAGDPTIYITQSGLPRIVLFGDDLRLRRPLSVSAWSDRLLMIAESETDSIRVRYEQLPRRLPGRGGTVPGRIVTAQIGDDLVEAIRFMARQPTDRDTRPGLGLSYSDVVSALWEIQAQGAIDAAFASEQDRLMADLYRAAESATAPDRPETDRPVENPVDADLLPPRGDPDKASPPVEEGGSLVVPLRPRPGAAGK